MMQSYFYELADAVCALLRSSEVLLISFSGEDSDFVRFNRSRIRQAGSVSQAYLSLDLIDGSRHATATRALSSDRETDLAGLAAVLKVLREQLPQLPEDPYLLYAADGTSGEQHGENRLPDRAATLASVLDAGEGRDLVGIYAQGGIYSGFANSLGQRNWFSTYSFNLNWSFYHALDKAVKSTYAGFVWSPEEFRAKVSTALDQLSILSRPATTIAPGRYRVYLAPAALASYMETLCWGGFSMKARRTKTTPLLRMTEEGAALASGVTITENTAEGIAPNFQAQGFLRPPRITLIEDGRYRDALVSPRTGKEYEIEPNGASGGESPLSLDMAPGAIPAGEVAARLDTGVYVNQTWYLNYSDRPAGRITGMTRFATFWVENGSIVAPLNVMRFDETVYRILGENLIGLTQERDFLPDDGTYGGRSATSMRLPGALIEDFTFTL